MLDELEDLRNHTPLAVLFSHYAKLAAIDRERWQARLMQLEGVKTAELSKLHGGLLAFGWLEQNTGQLPCCYRLTSTGLRAWRQVQRPLDGEATAETSKDAA